MNSKAREAFEAVRVVWDEADKRLREVQNQLDLLEQERDSLIYQMEALYPTLALLKQKDKSIDLESIVLPARIRINIKPTATIGDAVESLLRAKKRPMTRKELSDALKFLKISISDKNARVVLTNLVKKDARQRFEITGDAKIGLRESTKSHEAKDFPY